jgi:hypothetical protein
MSTVSRFLDLVSSSKLFRLLLGASSMMDGLCIASIAALLQRGGYLSSVPSDHRHRETAIGVAFMLSLKIDDEALDRCIERLLWYGRIHILVLRALNHLICWLSVIRAERSLAELR